MAVFDGRFLGTLAAGTGSRLAPGTYSIPTSMEIKAHLTFQPGAVLRPEAGATVSWNAGATICAGDYPIFDGSKIDATKAAGFRGERMVGWASSAWFPWEGMATGGKRDLGQQIGNAFRWNFLQVDVPPAPDHEIRTTVKLPHGSTVRCDWHGYPRHVVCATAGKPVFEAIGDVRHYRVIGGVYDGAAVRTPSCFMLVGRDEAGNQCGDTTPMAETHVTGNWGVGVVVNIAAEVLAFVDCALWIQGRGDSTWKGPQSTVTIGNADYWGIPYAYTKPTTAQQSCSAITFRDCDLRGGLPGIGGQVFLLKGQAEDLTLGLTYSNARGRCHILCEPGYALNPDNNQMGWTNPRGIHLSGGRTETNGGPALGVPTVLMDGLNASGYRTLEGLTIGRMGHFVGSQPNATPIVQAINGGAIEEFVMNQGGHIEWTNTLLQSRSTDLDWASIRSAARVNVDCGTRAIRNSEIWVGGRVIGNTNADTEDSADPESIPAQEA